MISTNSTTTMDDLTILPSPANSYARVVAGRRTVFATATTCTCGRNNCRHIPAFLDYIATHPVAPTTQMTPEQLEDAITLLYGPRR